MVATVVAMLLGERGRPHGVEEGAQMVVRGLNGGENEPIWLKRPMVVR